MSTPFEIPMKASTTQKLTVKLRNATYIIRARWNTAASVWVIDLLTPDGVEVLTGIPMVCGADLLEQFAYMDFGGQLIAQTDNDVTVPPVFANLGDSGHLYYVTP